jgi:hypothetical protein
MFQCPADFRVPASGVCQTEKLIKSREGFYPVLSSIPANTETELMPGQKLKQMPENSFSGIHGHPPKVERWYHQSKFKSKTENYIKEP